MRKKKKSIKVKYRSQNKICSSKLLKSEKNNFELSKELSLRLSEKNSASLMNLESINLREKKLFS